MWDISLKFMHLDGMRALPFRTIVIFALLFLSENVAFSSSAKLFLIQSHQKNKSTLCSATYIRFSSGCYLLSNDHCRGDRVVLHPAEISLEKDPYSAEYFSKQSVVEEVKVIRSSRWYDLMELEAPAQIKELCSQLEITKNPELFKDQWWRYSNKTVSAKGYVRGQAVNRFSQDINPATGWTGNQSVVTEWNFGPDSNNDRTIRVNKLWVTPGMSGGILVDTDSGNVIGLISLLKPFWDLSFAIPVDVMQRWVSGQLKNKTSQPVIKGVLAADHTSLRAEGALRRGGDNGLGHGGDNGLGHGGDNGLGHGGGFSSLEERISQDPLRWFYEDEEGIPNPLNENEILMGAVIDKKNYSVDDYDVYRLLVAGNKKAALVTRFKNQSPSPEIQSQILKRLDGYYHELLNDQTMEERHQIFARNEKAVEGWSALVKGPAPLRVDFNAKKKHLSLLIGQHFYTEVGNPLNTHIVGQVNLEFEIIPSSKNLETIILKSESESLRCENKNFLKLICTSPGSYLSFAILDNEKIRVRLMRYNLNEGWVNFLSSELKRASDSKKWRN